MESNEHETFVIANIDEKEETNTNKEKTQPNLLWVNDFTLTDQEADMITEPKWIYPNLIIQSHMMVFPAPPNGGKTTIFNWIAGEIAKNHQVFYVNADIAGADAKSIRKESIEKGFTLLLPDMKAGLSMNDVVSNLEAMNEKNSDYSNYIFIFDTLKKMTDVINKSSSKKLYKTLRGLSAKGMTVILLAHTNKYDHEGEAIFEGTGDLRSDVDEMIYLTPKKNSDGSMTVSTKPDKVRGVFEPITFNISPDRKVSLSNEYVDVITIDKQQKQLEKDDLAIQAITEAIKAEKFKQTEITTYCKELKTGIGVNSIRRVLKQYSFPPNKLWTCEKAFQNNTKQYFLIKSPPFHRVKPKSGKSRNSRKTTHR